MLRPPAEVQAPPVKDHRLSEAHARAVVAMGGKTKT
jgi:hypothetical protein